MFLFVVMLLDIPSTEILAHQRGTYPVAGVLGLCLIIAAVLALWQPLTQTSIQTLPMPLTDASQWVEKSRAYNGNLDRTVYSNSYCFWQNYRMASSSVANLGIALYGVHPDL